MGCTPRRDAAGRAAPARRAAPPRARQCARASRHAAVKEESVPARRSNFSMTSFGEPHPGVVAGRAFQKFPFAHAHAGCAVRPPFARVQEFVRSLSIPPRGCDQSRTNLRSSSAPPTKQYIKGSTFANGVSRQLRQRLNVTSARYKEHANEFANLPKRCACNRLNRP